MRHELTIDDQSAGGKARAAKLTAERRKEIASLAAKARWHKESACTTGKAELG